MVFWGNFFLILFFLLFGMLFVMWGGFLEVYVGVIGFWILLYVYGIKRECGVEDEGVDRIEFFVFIVG